MIKKDRTAAFFIALAGIYYGWNAFMMPLKADEAFIYLKSTGHSWTTMADTGLIEYILHVMYFFGDYPLNLRLVSIIFISFTLVMVFNLSYKISSRTGAWFSMMICFVSIPVSYSYISITPNALFVFASVLYIYALYNITVEKSSSIKDYTAGSIALLILVTTNISGILFIIFPFLYIIFQRELLHNKKYMVMSLSGVVWFFAVVVLYCFNLFELFYKYPFYKNIPFYYYMLILITYLPLLYIIMLSLSAKQKDNKSFFLLSASLFFGIFSLIINLALQCDIRNTGAFLIPSFILCGFYYEKYNYKLVLSMIIIVTVVTSAYTSVVSDSKLTPKNMAYTKIYELNRFGMQELVTLGDKLYSSDAGFSSLLAYNILVRPEACTIEYCSGGSGVFVSTHKEDDLSAQFENVKEMKIYRLFSRQNGSIQLYLYSVSGVKKEMD